jgi:hypothetical protein
MHVSDSFCFHHFNFFSVSAIPADTRRRALGSALFADWRAWTTRFLDTGVMMMRILHDKVLVEEGSCTPSPVSRADEADGWCANKPHWLHFENKIEIR